MVFPDEVNCDDVEQEEVKQRLEKAVSELPDLRELQDQGGVGTVCQVLVCTGPPT